MSCPEWRSALARRDDDGAWRRARVHLDSCPECRREALAIEPTLVFATASVPEVGDEEVASIKEAVHAARRARQTERSLVRPLAGVGAGAVAVALLAMVLLLPSTTSRPTGVVTPQAAAPAAEAGEPSPVVEALDRPQARIYQLGEEDLSVVMIVDESLDV